MLEYTEKMYVVPLLHLFIELIKGRKVIGKAFMRAMSDVLGATEVFKVLQEDNYW